jgi:hypothetical protein
MTNQFLSVKEKRDSEALQLLKNTHEIAINDLVIELKKKQLLDSQKTLDTLRVNRK